MRELDGYAQELTETASKEALYLIDNIKDMDPNTRIDKFKYFMTILTETLKRGEEKVALAKSTCEIVDRHCNRLDADLVKFEEEQPLGDTRITMLPGLGPSARNLKEGTDIRERATKRTERKELKGEKRKRKNVKEINGTQKKVKQSYKNGKPKTVVPTDMTIDPNEPLYCYCQQVSFGEMVACDNADCEIEWFHLACVDLKTVPKATL
ncbi:hypothetical protein RO3G_14253 [Rhizopus delemar RA 99-880]|uniref:Inhibitor of growth protein N-terminal histone-binding domain-containing protein n=1 Tax=Rhizopus delemar (strain RA 99-880 / ATCC MYA-4621 / FGSC 9543 / NRRL 43880) TaxID=246409 RepID=I1CM62_RHIO9|nr:hypothetical protein RO3G_14253 [Rhizopus delemar RA 99-880]|eukprot:EIE89542.1 hypothetical protein RO3G_14253 [Rhizopus delemar RA 99-880]